MILCYDFEGDVADHDAWHTREHIEERLSVPGFLAVSRWVSEGRGPRYMVLYEVSGIDVATSPEYLDRLNAPSAWTQTVMPRFRGMTRGFGEVVARSGIGIGGSAFVMRFAPAVGKEERALAWFSGDLLPELQQHTGIVSILVVRPAPPPPMTREQSIRGPDSLLTWTFIATAYERSAFTTLAAGKLDFEPMLRYGLFVPEAFNVFALHLNAAKRGNDDLPHHRVA